jgi:hypothetical protein
MYMYILGSSNVNLPWAYGYQAPVYHIMWVFEYMVGTGHQSILGISVFFLDLLLKLGVPKGCYGIVEHPKHIAPFSTFYSTLPILGSYIYRGVQK